jgi:hypothetical protein
LGAEAFGEDEAGEAGADDEVVEGQGDESGGSDGFAGRGILAGCRLWSRGAGPCREIGWWRGQHAVGWFNRL